MGPLSSPQSAPGEPRMNKGMCDTHPLEGDVAEGVHYDGALPLLSVILSASCTCLSMRIILRSVVYNTIKTRSICIFY